MKWPCRWRPAAATAFVAASCVSLVAGLPAGMTLLKGICYGPFPAKAPVYGSQLIDDFMSDSTKPLWGDRGRRDLDTIAKLGANMVRLYGNNPNYSHTQFLNDAQKLKLGVTPGLSDYPYTQQPGNCMQTDYDCYEQVKHAYLGNLIGGGFLLHGSYHPAIKNVIVINEPDLKLGQMAPKRFCKGILSAIDGILDAEKEAGVNLNGASLPNFTVTFSFGMCDECNKPQMGGSKPALNQMLELRGAFNSPAAYGYRPRNDLRRIYDTRFINSFNTQNSASELQDLFFTAYRQEFPGKPVFIGEFHSIHPPRDQQLELTTILNMAQASQELIGINFFEFQVRHDKGGSEMEFGMFDLGVYKIMTLEYFGINYDIWCLDAVRDAITRRRISEELTTAFGGDVDALNYFALCQPDPSTESLDSNGFMMVKGLNSNVRLTQYAERAVEHLGGKVVNEGGFSTFIGDQVRSFDDLVNLWMEKPSWATWDSNAACVADRRSDSYAVGLTIEKACTMSSFNCKDLTWDCKGDPWKMADYVLSTVYYLNKGNPLETCYFDGTAIFATSDYYRQYDTKCVVNRDPTTTPLTDEGYQVIMLEKNSKYMSTFIRRYITESLGARIESADPKEFEILAQKPPPSMYDLRTLLADAQWICGGQSKARCSLWSPAGGALLWWNYAAIGLLLVVVSAICCTYFCVGFKKQCHEMLPAKVFDSDDD